MTIKHANYKMCVASNLLVQRSFTRFISCLTFVEIMSECWGHAW